MDEQELTDEQVHIPEGADELWTAKPLTLRNSVLLVRLLATFLAKATIKAAQYADKLGSTEITEDLVMELLTTLDPPLMRTLLSIITGADQDVIEENFSLSCAVDVIVQFWQQEDMSRILGEIARLARNQEFQERHAG
jgi:hypothetical protein